MNYRLKYSWFHNGRKAEERFTFSRLIVPPATQDAHQHAPRIEKAKKFKNI